MYFLQSIADLFGRVALLTVLLGFQVKYAKADWEKLMIHCVGRNRSSPPEVFLGKDVLKKCSKFTGNHPCRSVISVKLQSNFIEIALRHG